MAYNNRCHAWYDEKEYAKVIADYDRTIVLDPAYALAYNNRGLARRAKGATDGASTDFDRARKLGFK